MQDPVAYITNPEKFGPGTWWTLTTLAYRANSYAENAAMANDVKYIIDNTPCLDPCRKHAQAYWQQNPATNHLTEPKGVFWWLVDFHNDVSRRWNREHPNSPQKPIFTKQQALQLYGQVSGVCTANCDNHGVSNNHVSIMQPQPPSPPMIPNYGVPTYTTIPKYKIVVRPLSPPRINNN